MTIVGGPVFWILVVLAVAAVVVFFERLLDLRRAQIDWQDFLKGVMNVLASGNETEALAICEDTPVPVAAIAAAAIRHRKGSLAALREAVDVQGRFEIARLNRRLTVLSVIGQLAPLIGLFGTIAGFIRTVMLINGTEIVPRTELMTSAVQAMSLAAGGLAIAIPVALMYTMLRLRFDRLISDLEGAATEIVAYMGQEKEAQT